MIVHLEDSFSSQKNTVMCITCFYTVMFNLCYYRATSDKANKLESTVEIYRQKLQDLNDLRKQVKTLQETNMMYMHNTVSLEEELKKANAARTQLETYKRQVRKYLKFFNQ